MSQDYEIWRLRSRRRRLDDRLREELARRIPDPLAVEALRQRKRNAETELLLAEAAPVGVG